MVIFGGQGFGLGFILGSGLGFVRWVYGLVICPHPLPRPVLVGGVVDGWGWWGGVVGGREGGWGGGCEVNDVGE